MPTPAFDCWLVARQRARVGGGGARDRAVGLVQAEGREVVLARRPRRASGRRSSLPARRTSSRSRRRCRCRSAAGCRCSAATGTRTRSSAVPVQVPSLAVRILPTVGGVSVIVGIGGVDRGREGQHVAAVGLRAGEQRAGRGEEVRERPDDRVVAQAVVVLGDLAPLDLAGERAVVGGAGVDAVRGADVQAREVDAAELLHRADDAVRHVVAAAVVDLRPRDAGVDRAEDAVVARGVVDVRRLLVLEDAQHGAGDAVAGAASRWSRSPASGRRRCCVAAKTMPGRNSVRLQTVSERAMPLPGAGGFQVAPPSELL